MESPRDQVTMNPSETLDHPLLDKTKTDYIDAVRTLRNHHIYNMGIQTILANRHIDNPIDPISKQDRLDAAHIYGRLMLIHDRHIKCIEDFPTYSVSRQPYLQTVLMYLQAIKTNILAESFSRWRELHSDGYFNTIRLWKSCSTWPVDVELRIMNILFDTWDPFRALRTTIDLGLVNRPRADSLFGP